MDSNTIGSLIYFGVTLAVAIISATIMRCKYRVFDLGDTALCALLGVVWPITVFGEVVYFASDFLCKKINAKKVN